MKDAQTRKCALKDAGGPMLAVMEKGMQVVVGMKRKDNKVIMG